MPNGNSEATLENWVKDIDGKVEDNGKTLVRIEAHLDSGHMTSAQNREDINKLQKGFQEVRDDYTFLKGQIAAVKWVGGIGVGLAVILQAVKMWAG